MGLGAARGGVPASGGEEHDRLPGVGGRLGEGASVAEVLGVHGDGPGALVPGAVGEQVDEGDVGLVAERDEPGEPEAVRAEAELEFEGEVAALAQQGHAAGGEGVGGQEEVGGVVGQAQAVRPDHHGTGGAHPLGDGLLPGAPGVTGLGEPCGDRDDRPGPAPQGLVDGVLETGGGHGDDREVDGLPYRAQAGRRGAAEDGAAAPVDQVDGAAPVRADRLGGDGVPVLGGVVAGSDDGDGYRVEECREVTSHVTSPAAARSWGRR